MIHKLLSFIVYSFGGDKSNKPRSDKDSLNILFALAITTLVFITCCLYGASILFNR